MEHLNHDEFSRSADIRNFWGTIEPFIDEVIEDFYNWVALNPNISHFITKENLARLKAAQRDHWRLSFTEGFGKAYEERLHRVGLAHARIGLNPELFVEGYGVLMRNLVERSRIHYGGDGEKMSEIVDKLSTCIFRDLYLGITSYREALEAEKNASNERTLASAHSFSDGMMGVSGEIQSLAAAISQMDASIGEISNSVDETSRRAHAATDNAKKAGASMSSLDEAAKDIRSVLHLIEDIAGRTKLLSLNAAIEAARAGDAGRGFAVVAAEVRRLADGTEQGAKEVSLKLNDVQSAMNHLRTVVDDVEDSFGLVLEASSQIASAIHEQKLVTGEMSNRMGNMQDTVNVQVKDLEQLIQFVNKSAAA
jgi:hypothetical protein